MLIDFGEQFFDQMVFFVDCVVLVILDCAVGFWQGARGDVARCKGSALVALGEHPHDGATFSVAHRMKLHVQATFSAPDTSGCKVDDLAGHRLG